MGFSHWDGKDDLLGLQEVRVYRKPREQNQMIINVILLFSLVDNVDVIYSSILDITNKPSKMTE